MKQFLLFALLAGATHAFFPPAETTCIFIETVIPCSPIVGGSVYIQLMSNASSFMLHFDKNANRILALKKGNVKIHDDYRNRTEFFINNGTLKITEMKKDDSGLYTAKIYSSDGAHLKDFSFALEVKDNTYKILIICLIALGALLLVVCCIVCCCCMFRKLKSGRTEEQSELGLK